MSSCDQSDFYLNLVSVNYLGQKWPLTDARRNWKGSKRVKTSPVEKAFKYINDMWHGRDSWGRFAGGDDVLKTEVKIKDGSHVLIHVFGLLPFRFENKYILNELPVSGELWKSF